MPEGYAMAYRSDYEDIGAMVRGLGGRRVLVVGDISLDEYLFGRATRLSREAPVPVIELTRREVILGAAANPARNVMALESAATMVGVVGDDSEGAQLRSACAVHGISAVGLQTVVGRPTTIKTRILVHEPPRLPQQVARLDRVDRRELTAEEETHIIDGLEEMVKQVDVVLCSDYQIGLLTRGIVRALRALCVAHGVLMTVDAQGNSHYYEEVDLFRCNDVEAGIALGRALRSEHDFREGLRELQQRLRARLVMVTRGPDGVSLIGADSPYQHIAATHVSDVYDTTGAGDTFIAVATLALAAGYPALMIATLANVAAARVVRKLGNAVVAPDELMLAMQEVPIGELGSGGSSFEML